jgi:DNA invertase Pin-like site-specific DNA recombinase
MPEKSSNNKAKRVALYIRVSGSHKTDAGDFRQNPDAQKRELEQMAAGRGWKMAKLYTDRMSGFSESRPGYKQLMLDAHKGSFDIVLVWSLDRWARSLKELINSVETLKGQSVDFACHQFPIDTTTAAGKLLYHVVGAFAEFEREILRERTRMGLDYAREHGTRSGKPIGGRPRVFRRDKVLELREKGWSYRRIAQELGLGHGTVQRACTTDPLGETGKPDGIIRTEGRSPA